MLGLNPHFLALQHALPSSCIFTASVLESAISSESWFLLLWNGIRNQDLGSMCVSCVGIVIAFRPSQLMKEKIHVYVLPPVCICNFYRYSCVSVLIKHELIWMSPTLIHHQKDILSPPFSE